MIHLKLHDPFVIESDFRVESSIFSALMKDADWKDSNELYRDFVALATGGVKMKSFFVKEIKTFNVPLLKLLAEIFRALHVRPRDFRCDLFKVLPGGELPLHVDQKSRISICIPLVNNTGDTYFEKDGKRFSICYQRMIVLNNMIPHGVSPPKKERILFRIGIHDIGFEEVKHANIL